MGASYRDCGGADAARCGMSNIWRDCSARAAWVGRRTRPGARFRASSSSRRGRRRTVCRSTRQHAAVSPAGCGMTGIWLKSSARPCSNAEPPERSDHVVSGLEYGSNGLSCRQLRLAFQSQTAIAGIQMNTPEVVRLRSNATAGAVEVRPLAFPSRLFAVRSSRRRRKHSRRRRDCTPA